MRVSVGSKLNSRNALSNLKLIECINYKYCRSRFIVEEKNERRNQPWFQSLYSDYDSKRQKMEQLDK